MMAVTGLVAAATLQPHDRLDPPAAFARERLDDGVWAPRYSGMGRSLSEASPSPTRRQALRTVSAVVWSALAVPLIGCAQEPAQKPVQPEWMRSKRGSTGNGSGRR